MITEKEKPLVSVVLIFLNAEKFIEDSIQSVLNQTYKNIEIILVDDGSTDNSTIIAKKYVALFPEIIRYLEHSNHQNKGISSSRNLGIYHAKGYLVAFIDSDDVWLPDKLSEQVQILLQHPDVDLLFGNSLYWRSWENPGSKDSVYKIGSMANKVILPMGIIPAFLNGQTPVPCPTSIIGRRDLFNEIIFEDDIIDLYDDQAFYFKVGMTKKIYISDKVWDKYRQHENSICNSAEESGKNTIARAKFLYWLWFYMEKTGIKNSEIKILLCRELWKINSGLFKKVSNKFLLKFLKYLFKIEDFLLPVNLKRKIWFSTKEYKLLKDNNNPVWRRSFAGNSQ